MSIRSRLLNRTFELLYGPLVFLHEPAGACLFGPSWHGRRLAVALKQGQARVVLDIGCGSGRLLAALDSLDRIAIGIDVSKPMLTKASRRGVTVVRASASALPLGDASVSAAVCTYPGSWIRAPDVWCELRRVLRPKGTITILLGGTVTRGRFARSRSVIIRVLYGRIDTTAGADVFPPEASTGLAGNLVEYEDNWGTVYLWEGKRTD